MTARTCSGRCFPARTARTAAKYDNDRRRTERGPRQLRYKPWRPVAATVTEDGVPTDASNPRRRPRPWKPPDPHHPISAGGHTGHRGLGVLGDVRGPAGRRDAPLPGRQRNRHRLRLRQRSLDRAACRRAGDPPGQPAGPGALSEVLCGRQHHRLRRQLRRQPRPVHDPRDRRNPGSGDVPSVRRDSLRLDARRSPVLLRTRIRWAQTPDTTAHDRSQRRSAPTVGDTLRCQRRVQRRRRLARLHAAQP